MSMFKERNKKSFVGDNRVTLDAKHNEMSRHFKQLRKSLPSKYKELDDLKNQYNELKNIPKKNLSDELLQKKFSLADSIIDLENEIKNIENGNEEYEYFLNTGQILHQYYDNIETVAKSKNNDKKQKFVNNNGPSVLDLFSSAKPQPPPKKKSPKPNDIPKKLTDFVTTTQNFKRADMLDNYLKIIDPAYVGNIEYDKKYDKCIACECEKTLVQDEGLMVCENCGQTDFIVIDSDRPSYKDPPPEVSYFAYKRSNHYLEWLLIYAN